ncbi:MAG: response regulator, partial [Anaerolineae bacterium]
MKERILIVEDDPDTLEMLASYFRRFDYQVVTAPFGQNAVDQATTYPPQQNIHDISQPDSDAYEVSRRLRQQERPRHLTV